MNEPHIRWIDDMGAALGAAIAAQESSRAPARQRRGITRRRGVAVALAVLTLGAATSAVPATRAAVEDLTSTFSNFVSGSDPEPPGRALRPAEDAPSWVAEESGRVIAETDGVKLYVSRAETEARGTQLRFTLPDGTAVFDSIDGWRQRFDDHAIVVLGTSLPREGDRLRPVLGVTAASVARVELRYGDGGRETADDLDGGFVIMADPARSVQSIVAFDRSGRALESVDGAAVHFQHVG